jgi:hypothetical protein
MDMIVFGDSSGLGIGGARGAAQRTVIEPDRVLPAGFIFDAKTLFTSASAVIDDTKALRSLECLSVVLRLLRFLPTKMKEKWLFELLTLMRVSPRSIKEVVKDNDWQPHLFGLVSEILEEVKEMEATATAAAGAEGSERKLTREQTSPMGKATLGMVKQAGALERDSFVSVGSTGAGDDDLPPPGEVAEEGKLLRTWSADAEATEAQSEPEPPEPAPEPEEPLRPPSPPHEEFVDVSMRFDLSMKLYSMLLAHSIREGGDAAFKALETAASLQRVCVNGHEVFCALFSHIMSDLTDNGTVVNPDEMVQTIEEPIGSGRGGAMSAMQRNKALKKVRRE